MPDGAHQVVALECSHDDVVRLAQQIESLAGHGGGHGADVLRAASGQVEHAPIHVGDTLIELCRNPRERVVVRLAPEHHGLLVGPQVGLHPHGLRRQQQSL